MAEEEKSKPEKKPPLAELHPELHERFREMGAVLLRAHEAKKGSGAIPGPLADEAAKLLEWADGVIAEAVEDPAGFDVKRARDRDTSAVALRLKGDEQLVSQLACAGEDLRKILGR